MDIKTYFYDAKRYGKGWHISNVYTSDGQSDLHIS